MINKFFVHQKLEQWIKYIDAYRKQGGTHHDDEAVEHLLAVVDEEKLAKFLFASRRP